MATATKQPTVTVKADSTGKINTRRVQLIRVTEHLGVPVVLQMYHDLMQYFFVIDGKWYQNHIQLSTRKNDYHDEEAYSEATVVRAASRLLRNAFGSIEDKMLPKSKKVSPTGKVKKG